MLWPSCRRCRPYHGILVVKEVSHSTFWMRTSENAPSTHLDDKGLPLAQGCSLWEAASRVLNTPTPCCSGLPNRPLFESGSGSLRGPILPATVRGGVRIETEEGSVKTMDIAVLAQLLSSLGTLVVAAGILYQGRQALNARNDTDRPQIRPE